MSPEEAMRKPWINITANWLLSSLTLFLLYWFTLRDASATETKKEIESKVSKIEMEKAFETHNNYEQSKIQQLEIKIENNSDEIADNKEDLQNLTKQILTELQGLRKEVLDLYKE